MFQLDPSARAGGTSLQGTVHLVPAFLVAAFGPPLEGDGDKVSGMYVFRGPGRRVFTVYDWMATSLGGNRGLPQPARFWRGTRPVEFHVGGRANADRFIAWLQEQAATWALVHGGEPAFVVGSEDAALRGLDDSIQASKEIPRP
jgi:hypothetical protein